MNETLREEYINKVFIIAERKYALNQEVVESFLEQIEKCHDNGFTPIRTVEFIANKIFS